MKEPRLFPNTVAGVLEALEMTFGKGIYADKVVDRLLKKNKKWGSPCSKKSLARREVRPSRYLGGGTCFQTPIQNAALRAAFT